MSTLRDNIRSFLDFKKHQWAHNTLTDFTSTLNEMADYLKDQEPTTVLIDQWFKLKLESGAKTTTVRQYGLRIQGFFRWAVKRRLYKFNPVEVIPAPKASEQRLTFTEDEYHKMLTVAHDMPQKWLTYAVLTGWNTGLRMVDVAKLKWEAVNLMNDVITLMPQKTKRHGKVVEIPLAGAYLDFLKDKNLNRMSPYVEPDMAAAYNRNIGIITVAFRDLMTKAGIEGKTFHCFRHTFITRYLSAGGAAAVLCGITGQTINQIMKYAHIGLDARRAEMAKMFK